MAESMKKEQHWLKYWHTVRQPQFHTFRPRLVSANEQLLTSGHIGQPCINCGSVTVFVLVGNHQI